MDCRKTAALLKQIFRLPQKTIEAEGLLPKSRLYVHLSSDPETARKVGSRHGRPVVFKVLAHQMQMDGYDFFLSENGVWLTKKVPAGYLQK